MTLLLKEVFQVNLQDVLITKPALKWYKNFQVEQFFTLNKLTFQLKFQDYL